MLLDALQDPARLQRLAEGAVTDTSFVSRVLRDLGAHWLPSAQEPETLLAALEQYGWRRVGIAPGAVFTAPDVECGLMGRISLDHTWFQAYTLRCDDQGWRPFRQTVSGVRTWLAPG